MWNSPVPQRRWFGFRHERPGPAAFASLSEFERAALDEITQSLADHEALTLGRLLARGKKTEIEMFIRTHGANPIFDPQRELEGDVGVAKSDIVSISHVASAEANQAVLQGRVAHVLFQAGDATRFQSGPFYSVNPVLVAKGLLDHNPSVPNGQESLQEEEPLPESFYSHVSSLLAQINESVERLTKKKNGVPLEATSLLVDWPLGPKQSVLLRASLRRLIHWEMEAGRLSSRNAMEAYRNAISNQKIMYFVSRRGGVNETHDQIVRKERAFFGFNPLNIVTIEQELARGISANEEGTLTLCEGDDFQDAAGHLYALIQSARPGDFTTYTESGRPIKPMELDALAYLINRGAKIMSIIRINDMDRHSTEICNTKALSFALNMFAEGYVNVIETVANPEGQKGGTGITFGDPAIHVLTETHENSFPALSRAFEAAMKVYLQENNGNHPAYNAMRQWADLPTTRRVLREFGGRIVFVPRQKQVKDSLVSYVGVDMPMGDLSLLTGDYKSRMFQFSSPSGGELLIHDMKKKENIPIALRTILRQLEDPHVLAAATEIQTGAWIPFSDEEQGGDLYGAPAPEFYPQKTV